jgi:hypothetical protein
VLHLQCRCCCCRWCCCCWCLSACCRAADILPLSAKRSCLPGMQVSKPWLLLFGHRMKAPPRLPALPPSSVAASPPAGTELEHAPTPAAAAKVAAEFVQRTSA